MNIKECIIGIVIAVMIGILRFIYMFMKLLPTNHQKILFCSRQSDEKPLDFQLLDNRIKEKQKNIKSVFICQRIHTGLVNHISFAFVILRSMYHLATSKVCIIDSFWPAVSLLRHKKSLSVIQMWHSLGKTKKSGYQTLDKVSGRNESFALKLHMHENYDYLVGGAKVWNPYYCEAFNISEDKILNCGLPRIDYLINTEEENKERFFKEFPQLKNKKIVLYAPTFRRKMKTHWQDITKLKDLEDIVIILKSHPSQHEFICHRNSNILLVDSWKTLDLISVCDYLITDYSSIALEAAVLNKKTYYWTYDYDEYMKNNGTNIDIKKELSGNMYKSIKTMMDHIKVDAFNYEQFNNYRKKYLPEHLGGSTEYLATLVLKLANRRHKNDEVNTCV